MKILIACSEAAPYAKTGGLADVTGALMREFRRKGQHASLILPLYPSIRKRFAPVRTRAAVKVALGNFSVSGSVWASDATNDPEAYFIECEPFFGRPELYGTAEGDYTDNAVRFIFFARAVLETCRALDISPDVIHCNDWQTGLIPFYLKTLYRDVGQLHLTASVLTVHNLGYQGVFDAGAMQFTGIGQEYFVPEHLEFYGRMNYLKAGLVSADLLSTVSPTYAREILTPEHGFGLDGVLRSRQDDLRGIINGIDHQDWDPQHDVLLPSPYGPSDLRGKKSVKTGFCRQAGIRDRTAPLFGVVSRLSSQKGLDLVLGAFDDLMALGCSVAVLGKGDEEYQERFAAKGSLHAGRASVTIGFAEEDAHRIYGAADFFLMPSRYEPCGIGQLIAMRYGTVPIARRTGGLADTISDYDHLKGSGTGFLFEDLSPAGLMAGVKRALCVYRHDAELKPLVRRCMEQNFGWSESAEQYLNLYVHARSRVVR